MGTAETAETAKTAGAAGMSGEVGVTEASGELSAEEKRQQRLQALANRGIN